MSQRLSRMALPVLSVSSRAISSRSRSMSPATRSSRAARSAAGLRGQSVVSKVRRAAAMAAATCASVATSTSVTRVPSDGLTTGLQEPSPDATHWPSMYRDGMAGRMESRRRRRQGPVARLASGQRFERLPVAEGRRGPVRLARPACRVGDDSTDRRVEVGRMRLVAGSEVEDATAPALVAATAAEDLAALEPADQDQAVGCRDVEVLAVYLLVVEDERFAQSGGDRVSGVDHPDPFAFPGLTPLEAAGRAHQASEDPREVARMEDDEAHPVEDPRVDAIEDLVGDIVMRHVAPPGEDV